MNAQNERGMMRIPGLRGLVRLLLLAAMCLSAHSAWALTCFAGSPDARTLTFTESIGSVQTYPENVPDGTIIWISPTRTTTGYCQKDLVGGLDYLDPVSFYANPQSITLPGLQIGIRFNGQDVYDATSVPGGGLFTGTTVPTCTTDQYVSANGGCPPVPVSFTYQVVVRKQGTWTGTLPDTYNVFQFDGVNGINCCRPSFNYILSGLSKLAPTPCTVDVTVTPEPGIVDFGQVQSTPTGFQPARPTKNFSLLLQKKECGVGVNIQGYFQTSNQVQNNMILPESDSNFGIGIQDGGGRQVPIGEPFDLQNFSETQTSVSIPFTATLTPLGVPKIGPFEAIATVLILYN
ncbi:fimbrial protein [Burkholderia sp. SRS-W-2-2016]|uniref:fimbrial protein n=1 Tax=Burkholderia sp. SRS-W-2-2016 TaxID=1926878 RepID=UPI00094B1834|nr:fimbrial protein [Burkholderia sp. SRS-W-2-2016]OLL28248.1 fimbrial protein [Burkholderia sp. SRS-W-2-2016]